MYSPFLFKYVLILQFFKVTPVWGKNDLLWYIWVWCGHLCHHVFPHFVTRLHERCEASLKHILLIKYRSRILASRANVTCAVSTGLSANFGLIVTASQLEWMMMVMKIPPHTVHSSHRRLNEWRLFILEIWFPLFECAVMDGKYTLEEYSENQEERMENITWTIIVHESTWKETILFLCWAVSSPSPSWPSDSLHWRTAQQSQGRQRWQPRRLVASCWWSTLSWCPVMMFGGTCMQI